VGGDWYVEHLAGWERVVAELRERGWDVQLLSCAAPVQLVGTLPSGESFYFSGDGARLLHGLVRRYRGE
jgi:hypothetical protein